MERDSGHVVHVVVREAENPDPVRAVSADKVAHDGLYEPADRWVVVEIPSELVQKHTAEAGRDVESGHEGLEKRGREEEEPLDDGEDERRVVVESGGGEQDEAREAVRPLLDPLRHDVH